MNMHSISESFNRATELAKQGFSIDEIRATVGREIPFPMVRRLVRVTKSEAAQKVRAERDLRAREAAEAAALIKRFRIIIPRPRGPTVADLIAQVCLESGLSKADLIGPRRYRQLVIHRQRLMYLAVSKTSLSFPTIARIIGNRDHTTIIHGVRAHCARTGDPLPRGMWPEGGAK